MDSSKNKRRSAKARPIVFWYDCIHMYCDFVSPSLTLVSILTFSSSSSFSFFSLIIYLFTVYSLLFSCKLASGTSYKLDYHESTGPTSVASLQS